MKRIGLSLLILCLFGTLSYAQWTTKYRNTNVQLNDIHFPDANTGYAVGSFMTVLKSTNAGETWFPLTVSGSGGFSSVWFVGQVGLTVGMVSGSSGVKRTTNAGSIWTDIVTPDSFDWNTVHSPLSAGSMYWYIAGDGDRILYTSSAGASWTRQWQRSNTNFAAIWFVGLNRGYAGGEISNVRDYVIRTTDGGANWLYSDSMRSGHVHDMHFSSINTGYVVDGQRRVLKTTDGGLTWTEIYTSSRPLYAVNFPRQDTGWVAGRNLILRTTNGGQTWMQQACPESADCRSIYFQPNDARVGWIAAADPVALIFKTTNGGSWVSDNEITGKIGNITPYLSISPNPVKTKTTISYSLSDESSVELGVFDVHGRKVAVLVDDHQTGGNHEVTWDIRNITRKRLPNGVYFNTLRADGFTLSKKIVVTR